MGKFVCLMYHELGQPGRPVTQGGAAYQRYVVQKHKFREQIVMLHDTGFQGMDVSGAIASTDGKRTLAISFDDGCETDLIIAAPILEENGFGATFYVVSGFIGKPGYLSLSQLKELSARGFEIGCHSRSHPNLTRVDDEQLHEEVTDAKADLEQIIERQVRHFSCPGGFWSEGTVKAVAAAGFATMATSRPGVNYPRKNGFVLARNTVYESCDPARFGKMCLGKGLFVRRSGQAVFDGAKLLLGESFYRRVRSVVLNAGARPDGTLSHRLKDN